MKTNQTHKVISITLLSLSLSLCARAGSITNNFDAPVDFLATGVAGTMWDGVYFGAGDVPMGTTGVGTTLAANTTTLPVIGGVGYLYVQSTGGGWEGAQDDGFFLFKNVAGDFDVSVQIAGSPWQNVNYHFAGLLARASAFPQGVPFNPTGTNASENFVNITRFQEFNTGDSVRVTTNGALPDPLTFNYAGDNSDTNTTRYVRIVRSGNTFSFYDKTNAPDAWSLKTSITRADFNGVVMQVGLEQAVYTGNSPFVAFTDFELSGPNVTNVIGIVTPPADPTGLTFSSPDPSGKLTLSWTAGAGSAGSLVLLRAATNSLITQQPAYGFTYISDTNFASTSNFFGGQGYHIAYVGSGNSVKVSGLGGDNNTYSAAVFSYAGSGASTIYGPNPATGSAAGPGALTNVTFVLIPSSIPVGGAASATVHAYYSTGDSYDVSTAPGTIWSSSDPASALATNGTVTGLAAGTNVTISADYAGVVGTNSVSVHVPAFTDNFSTSHDFVAKGLPGSQWNGLYLRPGDLPGADNGGSIMFATTNDINITTNNALTLRAGGTDWEGTADDGYFLFKNVPGDFQAMVHITNLQHGAYQFVGLMARAANADGSAYLGSENHVNWWFFDQYSVVTSARSALNGNVDVFADQNGTTPANTIWLLLQRVNGTNFYCFQRFNANDPWTFMPNATIVQPLFTNGVPLQVGLAQSTFTASPAELVQFDNFMLDAANISSSTPPPPPAVELTMVSNPDLSITCAWIATNSTGAPVQSMVVMRADAPVSAQPPYGFLFSGNSVFGQGASLGSGNYVVFRSANPPASISNTVTVTGLSPGVAYYAAVYTFVGGGTTKVFQPVGAPERGITNGTLLGMETVMPAGGIPVGGVGTPVVYGVFSGGALVPITPSVIVTSDDPTVVIGTNGVLSGLAPGTANVHFIYQTFTNQVLVTVRPPGFTDNFGVNHDYVANGVTGSAWDGVYLGANSFPNQGGGNDGQTLVGDANISLTNSLTVTSTLTDWAGGDDDGFLLFKHVPGDFQAAVHITSQTTTINYLFAGLMARAYGTNGAPSLVGTNYLENWVYLGEFNQFNDDVESRRALDGADREFPGGPGTDDWWLLMKRDDGTNFTFFKKLNATDPYMPLTSQDFAHPRMVPGVPVQVGLFAATYTANIGTVQFDSFMLDSTGLIAMTATASGGSVIIKWPTAPGVTLESTLTLTPTDWRTVGAVQHQTGDGYTYVTLTPSGTAFFRLVH